MTINVGDPKSCFVLSCPRSNAQAQIAQLFFQEVLALGRLADSSTLRERISPGYSDRLKFILRYLARLEVLGGLKFQPRDAPFFCWLNTGDDDTPIAGSLAGC